MVSDADGMMANDARLRNAHIVTDCERCPCIDIDSTRLYEPNWIESQPICHRKMLSNSAFTLGRNADIGHPIAFDTAIFHLIDIQTIVQSQIIDASRNGSEKPSEATQ